jgi:hypothetical protein
MCFILVLRLLVSPLLNNLSQISLQLGFKKQNLRKTYRPNENLQAQWINNIHES